MMLDANRPKSKFHSIPPLLHMICAAAGCTRVDNTQITQTKKHTAFPLYYL